MSCRASLAPAEPSGSSKLPDRCVRDLGIESASMPRPRRWFLGALATVSLVVCLGVTAATVWSCFVSIEICRDQTIHLVGGGKYPLSRVDLSLYCGRVSFSFVRIYPNQQLDRSTIPAHWAFAQHRDRGSFPILEAMLGFYFHSWKIIQRSVLFVGINIHFPTWPFILTSGFLFAAHARRRRGEAWQASGNLCIFCGYDLRATPHRCPECGAIPQNPPVAAPTESF